ncbi:MAG: peptidase MA family metallohydrolase [Armatimonadetes bacterium]|nr:peptidase MA family metallohydrolase [Armatimonadota bacterium]
MITSRSAVSIFAIALMLIITSSTPLLAQEKGAPTELTATMRTRYFIVRYNPSDPYLANLMARVAQDELIRVSKILGYSPDPDQPFPLRIYKSHRSFIREEGILNKYTVGTAQSGSAAIALDASGALIFPQEPLAHEITHAIIFRILGPLSSELPLWFNEGLAKHESGAYEGNDNNLVADASADGSLISLSTLQTEFPEKRTDLSYAESASAIRLLIKKYGNSAPKAIIQDMTHTGSFEKSMLKVTGESPDHFAALWYDDTTKRYWAWKLMRIVTTVLWTIMAILAIIAFTVRRRRMAAAAKQWEQEEFEEALRRQQGNDWSL